MKTKFIILIVMIFFSLKSSYSSSNENANMLFVESVQQWQKFEVLINQFSDDLELQYELLNEIDKNIKKIINDYPGSSMAVEFMAFRKYGVLSLDKVDQMLVKVKSDLIFRNQKKTKNLICEGKTKKNIIVLANYIINNKNNLGKFHKKRVGGSAAYLILKYENLNNKQAIKLFEKLEPFSDPYGLQSAFNIHKNGVKTAINVSNKNPAEWFYGSLNHSNLREIILSDDGVTFFNLLNKYREYLNEIDKSKSWRYSVFTKVPFAILDQSDEFKLKFSQLAEFHGEIEIAGIVLASRKNLREYKEFLHKYKSNEQIIGFINEKSGFTFGSGIFSLYQDEIPYISFSENKIDKKERQDFFDILKVSFSIPESDFFSIALNQSGLTDKFGKIARLYLEAKDLNGFSSSTLADEHWIFIYRSMIQEMGKDETNGLLSSFDVRLRYFSGNVPETISWFLALKELVPYVKGEINNIPKKSNIFIDTFDWEKFAEVALVIKNQRNKVQYWKAFNEKEIIIAAEILFGMEEVDEALIVIDELKNLRLNITIKESFMHRLDKQCLNYTSFPGTSLWNGGDDVFLFTGKNQLP